MSEVDAQALQIRRKHVGLPHLYGEAPVAVEEARRHWERQLLVIAAELLQQQRRGQGGDGAAGADDGGGCFLLGSDGMKGLAAETKNLVSQQKELVDSLGQMAPVLKSAKTTLDSLNLPDMKGLTSMLSTLKGGN